LNPTTGHLQATLSKLLNCVLRSTEPPTLSGMELGTGSGLWPQQAMRWWPILADWGSGMPAGCSTGPTVCGRGQWMPA